MCAPGQKRGRPALPFSIRTSSVRSGLTAWTSTSTTQWHGSTEATAAAGLPGGELLNNFVPKTRKDFVEATAVVEVAFFMKASQAH